MPNLKVHLGEGHEAANAWMLQLMTPVSLLTRENLPHLAENDYMVSPKADGERMLLFCESSTNDFYLVSRSAPPLHVQGNYGGPEHDGFLLDTEVVTIADGVKLILAFDICCVGWPFYQLNLSVENYRAKGYPFEDYYTIESLEKRRFLLEELARLTTIPGLVVKPIEATHDVEILWEGWQNLPYRTDGLVFTPCSDREPAFKWKPTSELTVDVALGAVIEQTSAESRFLAHLYYSGELNDDASGHSLADRSDITATDKLANVTPGHVRFCLLEHRHWRWDKEYVKFGGFEKIPGIPVELTIGDIALTHEEDVARILAERIEEGEHWCFENQKCSSELCPCDELLAGTSCCIAHCINCGALGVKEYNNMFSCRICQKISPPLESRSDECHVWLPNELSVWARHGIVEVEYAQTSTLKFKRLRRDKQSANSVKVANDILESHERPIKLSDIKPKSKDSLPTISTLQTGYRQPLKESDNKSSFRTLRIHHSKIKRWLYQVFGGRNILDACSGGLHDIENWVAAGFLSVLALENDRALYEEGLLAIKRMRMEARQQSIKINLIRCDLSVPLVLPYTAKADQVDGIFCNFAIHYFWDSDKTTRTFFDNICMRLRDGGFFVVTYLQGELLRNRRSISIYNENGMLEFEARNTSTNGPSAEVYVASIGAKHVESLIELDELKVRFNEAGLELVSCFPFESLGNMFLSKNLTSPEKEMSSLYAAAVFKKRKKMPLLSTLQVPVLFDPVLPTLVEEHIFQFFSIPDLLKCRLLSRLWHEAVESFEISEDIKQHFFSDKKNTGLLQCGDAGVYAIVRRQHHVLPPSSIGLYFRMGGPPIQMESVARVDDRPIRHTRDPSDYGYDPYVDDPYDDFLDGYGLYDYY